MNLQSKFVNCITTQILNIALYMLAGDGKTNQQTDKLTDGRTIETLDVPGRDITDSMYKDWVPLLQCLYLLMCVYLHTGFRAKGAFISQIGFVYE